MEESKENLNDKNHYYLRNYEKSLEAIKIIYEIIEDFKSRNENFGESFLEAIEEKTELHGFIEENILYLGKWRYGGVSLERYFNIKILENDTWDEIKLKFEKYTAYFIDCIHNRKRFIKNFEYESKILDEAMIKLEYLAGHSNYSFFAEEAINILIKGWTELNNENYYPPKTDFVSVKNIKYLNKNKAVENEKDFIRD